MQNLNVFNVFLRVFSEVHSEQMRSLVLKTIATAMHIVADDYTLVSEHCDPFKILFSQFDPLPFTDKFIIVDMLSMLISKSSSPHFSHEMQNYCSLLRGNNFLLKRILLL